jgi:hypothetical protein
MGEMLRVLVYGSIDGGVCDFVRLGVYRDLLTEHGVELRTWGEFNDYAVQVPADYADRLDDAVHDGVATVDLSPIEWADVILFRRWYGTVHACEVCDFAAPDQAAVARHSQSTGHPMVVRDRIIRSLLNSIENDRSILRGRAMVYELDDALLDPQPWNTFHRRIQGDLDLIERLARAADLVTVTTPALAANLARYNDAVRVIRNAVNTSWYDPDPAAAEPRPLSFMYYGVAARLRDYAICRDAVDEVAHATGGRRIWLGSDAADVRAVVDEALPYADDVRDFARRLVAAGPAIGVAPVGQDAFSRCHSELHWIEYSLAGAATVASRTMGGGPYDVIRDGVDGLLARNKAEWRDGLRRLAGSPQMRQEMAGRARERVLAEYDVRQRAGEWADAFRWTADHAGRGAIRGLTRGLPRPLVQARELAVRTEAQATLAHRRMARARSIEERDTLARLRGDRDVCWPESAAVHPLVTIRIPTYNRGPLVVERAVGSALAQTYDNIEVVVVGDGATPETVAAVSSVQDPRLRFENLPRPTYPADPERRWMVAGTHATNRALELARGAWIAPLDDDDEFTPDHVEVLLAVALEYRLELVYGQSLMEMGDGRWQLVGAWPPVQGGFCHGSVLYAAGLTNFRYDAEAWRLGEPGDWNMWRRMLEAGVRMGNVEHVVYRHFAEARHRPMVVSPAPQSTVEQMEAAS